MQAGFAMCEAGFTRAKNTGNILMKNLMDFCIGTPTYWILGFRLMFSGAGAIIGGFDPFVRGDYAGVLPAGVLLYAYLIFQTVFCATSKSAPAKRATTLFRMPSEDTVTSILFSRQAGPVLPVPPVCFSDVPGFAKMYPE